MLGLRGVKANIPALFPGEEYFATDEVQKYVGTSSLGNCPLSIPVFNAAGVRQQKAHVVINDFTMTSSTNTITLTGSAVFTSAASYVVLVTTAGVKRTLTIVRNSGSSFTVSGGGVGDVISYICIGT